MIKTIKSEPELAYIRKAAEITDKAMQLVINKINTITIKNSITSSEIAAIILNCQMNLGGTNPAITPMIMVNENAGHMNWTNDKLKKGDIIKIEFASSYLHYHCPISRTIIIGPAITYNSKISHIKKISQLINCVLTEILNNIKEDVTCSYIATIFNKFINKNDITKNSRIGYSFGDWIFS